MKMAPSVRRKWSPGLEGGILNRMQAGAVFYLISLYFVFVKLVAEDGMLVSYQGVRLYH